MRGFKLQETKIAFSTRVVAFGFTEGLPVEVAVLSRTLDTWVVLRESVRRPGQSALLATYFEYIASSLRTELVYLKRLPEPLIFFHCTYEAGQGEDVVRWVFKEAKMGAERGGYAFARWDRAPQATQAELSAALSLSGPPKRTCL